MGNYNNDRFRRGSGGGGYRDRSHGDRPTLFSAVCFNCGKNCQVPFKPTGEKPVYCSDCFQRDGEERGGNRDNYNNPRRSYDRPEKKRHDTQVYRPEPKPPVSAQDFKELVDKVNSLSYRMDKVLAALDAQIAQVTTAAIQEEAEPQTEDKPKAKSKAKVTVKAKAKKPTSKKKAPKKK